jgi:hypothetical protein
MARGILLMSDTKDNRTEHAKSDVSLSHILSSVCRIAGNTS